MEQQMIMVCFPVGDPLFLNPSQLTRVKYFYAYNMRVVVRRNWMRFVPSPSMLFTCSLNRLLVYFWELFMLVLPALISQWEMTLLVVQFCRAPEVVNVPIPESEHDELAKRHPGVFVDKVLRQYRPLADPKCGLCGSLFASVLAEGRLPPVIQWTDCPRSLKRSYGIPQTIWAMELS